MLTGASAITLYWAFDLGDRKDHVINNIMLESTLATEQKHIARYTSETSRSFSHMII